MSVDTYCRECGVPIHDHKGNGPCHPFVSEHSISVRLRQGVDPANIPEAERAMDAGADKIERLSAALREITIAGTWTGSDENQYSSVECRIARAALT